MPKAEISHLFATVTMIRALKEGKLLGKASGFFYLNGGKLFLVTNRHVVIDEGKGHLPDQLLIRVHADTSNFSKNAEEAIALYKDNEPLWREHPASNIDIAAMELALQKFGGYFIKAFSRDNLVPQDIVIDLGADAMVLGFPFGFHDEVHNVPIIRNATIASAYPVPFRGKPFFLIDAKLHQGTSGSPVLTKPTNMLHGKGGETRLMSEPVWFLLGIHSASIDVITDNTSETLGLNVVWFAELIEEITN